ncbi:fungal-specific transcription factor domain-containing protein [Dactylonectria estremocensis]|uniref:Fungal-specific transcription factor domain-containing protein n=1 Tax=Dactylonectria estremocensis TaxID=1079267 RepID=A0A9P9FAT3_9HYPO|nr:fungal-specific transcription factor domain-containing protein [Dactylonectria estremocensis]
MGKTLTTRVRVVEGSCWPCKKRRIKCDLGKPSCARCGLVGASCDYNTRLIRWSTRPALAVPPMYRAVSRDEQLAGSLAVYEKRALDYFHGRFWPLLTTASEPCSAPILVALEHRVVLLATCVLADAHRWLQDGRNSRSILNVKRLECLAALRVEVDDCCAKGDGPLQTLLFAVLLLYFHDGFLECVEASASTSSHRDGVLAIVDRLGGITAALDTGQDPLHLLLSEFLSADLGTAILKGRVPSFPPSVWESINKGPVWWGQDTHGRHSLSAVFREISSMAFYLDATSTMREDFSISRIREFEAALQPIYAPLAVEDLDSPVSDLDDPGEKDLEATHAYALIRAFQHSALIYLYRAICGLPMNHPLVQQHTQSCLDCIFGIRRPSKVLNCIVLPLCIAGAHAQTAKEQKGVRGMVSYIHDEIRFASIHSLSAALEGIWKVEIPGMTWSEMFSELNPEAIIL